ncbi:hypothetical protein MOO44_07490 [Nicoliella spurrieriana]|uniref:Uncharacterized protein n=1 Tax=Nicoliella spurrieriana TaxID=2925830 RepID=A0A976RRV9_9LACO|nr:hypothetical protein [Nicoliella spurrieriana]UQS86718.1 hypothetical protein MOO44_07490 [Nicoliella spurrieriana]
MQIKTKIRLGIAITAVAAIEVLKSGIRARVEHRIYHQIHQQFGGQTIYGTWLHPEYRLIAEDYYLGGVNIVDGQTITEYQFTASGNGKLVELYKTDSHQISSF